MIMMKGKISKAEVLCSQLPIIATAEYAFVDPEKRNIKKQIKKNKKYFRKFSVK